MPRASRFTRFLPRRRPGRRPRGRMTSPSIHGEAQHQVLRQRGPREPYKRLSLRTHFDRSRSPGPWVPAAARRPPASPRGVADPQGLDGDPRRAPSTSRARGIGPAAFCRASAPKPGACPSSTTRARRKGPRPDSRSRRIGSSTASSGREARTASRPARLRGRAPGAPAARQRLRPRPGQPASGPRPRLAPGPGSGVRTTGRPAPGGPHRPSRPAGRGTGAEPGRPSPGPASRGPSPDRPGSGSAANVLGGSSYPP